MKCETQDPVTTALSSLAISTSDADVPQGFETRTFIDK